jgi:2-dehydro-3-deoxygluconokinase
MRGGIGAVGEGLFELGLDEDLASSELRRGLGGDAANVLVMAARLGVPARLCARVGDDALGRMLRWLWREAGVDIETVRIDPDAATGIYVNERRVDGGHRFYYHRALSAGSRLTPEDVTDAFLAGLEVIFATGVTLAISATAAQAVDAATKRARAAGATVAFALNYRPALGGDPGALVTHARAADVVFASVEDLELILGAGDPAEMATVLRGRAHELVITAGESGAAVDAGDGFQWFGAPSVGVLDTAGAGDALAGAYLASRLLGHPPLGALARGVGAAALSCEHFGAALSYPSADAVERVAETIL